MITFAAGGDNLAMFVDLRYEYGDLYEDADFFKMALTPKTRS